MKALGETLTDLPGMAPCATSIVAMVRQTLADAWPTIRTDPAALLWLAQNSQSDATTFTESIIASANRLLRNRDCPFVDWRSESPSLIYLTCLRQAHFAERMAERLGDVDPRKAWTAAFLAPLGLLVAAVAEPDRDRSHEQSFDHNATTRRLCRRWNLPEWLTQIIGNLGLPVGVAEGLGADRVLFQIVQLSVSTIANGQSNLGIAVGDNQLELQNALGFKAEQIDKMLNGLPDQSERAWRSPYEEQFLPDLLELAQVNRNGVGAKSADRLEQEIDALHHAVHQHSKREANRLHKQKMEAMAEFAAGAGHEINNPLAVISGQAQYLLRQLAPTEPEADATPEEQKFHNALCGSLQTIVGQTERIHRLLHNIIQFARPTRPQIHTVDGLALIAATIKQVLPLAKQRQIELRIPKNIRQFQLDGDPKQLHTILTALVRNAIEAAPDNGWASLRVELDEQSAVIVVEDNGSGVTPLVRRHMFDPFFCGRSAGRGSGLGLPVAWKLAQLNKGTLTIDDGALPAARFVLRLPLHSNEIHSQHEPTRNGFHHIESSMRLSQTS